MFIWLYIKLSTDTCISHRTHILSSAYLFFILNLVFIILGKPPIGHITSSQFYSLIFTVTLYCFQHLIHCFHWFFFTSKNCTYLDYTMSCFDMYCEMVTKIKLINNPSPYSYPPPFLVVRTLEIYFLSILQVYNTLYKLYSPSCSLDL